MSARRLRERLFHALVFTPALLGVLVLAAVVGGLLLGSVSWQVVEPRGSGASFGFWEGFSLAGSWEKVVRLELAARGLGAAESDRLLSDPESRRRFAARNRVELMWEVDGRPLRWVVTTSSDVSVESVALARGLRERGALLAALQPGQRLLLNPWLDAGFLTRRASRSALMAGLAPALLGSMWLMVIVILVAVPLGVATAVYLEEYGGDGLLARLLEVNLRNLAGVPSVVYGLLGLSVFVRALRLGPVLLAAALTLSLLVVPVVVVATREGLRAVPDSLRQAALGMGASRSQVAFRVVLPAAAASIVTGTILAVARALGETAPLLLLGAAAFVSGLPAGPLSPLTALPVQVYSWVGETDPEFVHVAAAGIVVLLALLAFLYLGVYELRRRFERRW